MQYYLLLVFAIISIAYTNCGSYQSMQESLSVVNDSINEPAEFLQSADVALFDINNPVVLTQNQLNSNTYSDFYFYVMPEDYQASFDQEFSGEANAELNDINYDEPFKTSLSGLNIDYKYNYTLDFDTQSLSFDMLAQLDRLNFSIDKIITDDMVEQSLAGVHISLPIKGECYNLNLRSRASVATKALLSIVDRGDKYFLEVGDIDIDLQNIDWDVSFGSCNGPVDYADLLEAEILKLLKDKKYILPILENEMKAQANKMVQNIMGDAFDDILKPTAMALEANGQLHIIPEKVDIVKSTAALKISGKVVSYYQNNKGNKGYHPFLMDEIQDEGITNSGFLVSQEFIQKFNQNLHGNDAYFYSVSGTKVEGLQSLINLGWQLAFVFPDLRNYSSANQFLFEFYSGPQSRVPSRSLSTGSSTPELTLTNSSSGALSFGANFKLNTDMYAKRNGSFVTYMHFRSDVVAPGSISVNNNKLVFESDRPNISLTHEWNKSYVDKFRPNQKFDKNRFREEIEKNMKGEKYSKELPSFELTDTRQLLPKRLRLRGNDWLQIIYSSAAE